MGDEGERKMGAEGKRTLVIEREEKHTQLVVGCKKKEGAIR